MIVDVSHPASVTYVPRGGRSTRRAYMATRTPVEIASVQDREVREVGPLRSMQDPPSLHEHRGVLWIRLTHVPYIGERRNVRPEEWAGWLSGERPPSAYVAKLLSNAVAMSPLAALDHKALARRTGGDDFGRRGEALDLAVQRDVAADGRDAAARDVARFMAEETLVTGTAVHVRYRPVAHERASCPAMAGTHWSLDLRNLPLSPRHARSDIVARHYGASPSPAGMPPFAEDLQTLEPFIEDGVDVTLLANWLPGELAIVAEERSRTLTDPDGRGHARATLRAAEALAAIGDVGGVAPADARDFLEDVTQLAIDELHGITGIPDPDCRDVVRSNGLLRPHREEMMCRALHHLNRILERTAAEAEPDDEAAMAGLGVRP